MASSPSGSEMGDDVGGGEVETEFDEELALGAEAVAQQGPAGPGDGEADREADGAEAGGKKRKSKGGGGGQGGEKKKKFADGYAVCKVCLKKIPLKDMPENSAKCAEDKSYAESLWRLAKQQGQKEWYHSIVNDEKIRQAILAYKTKSPAYMPSKKKGTFEIAVYTETLKMLTEFVMTQKGEMMWEGLFTEFYMSARGGSHSKDEATAKWAEMEREGDSGVRLSNFDGPNEKKPKQLWTPTGTDVDRVNRLMHVKSLALQEKAQKKPTDEYINAKKAQAVCQPQ